MNIAKFLLSSLLLPAALAWQPAVLAAEADAAASAAAASAPLPSRSQYSEKGADTCLYCHDSDSDTATFVTAGVFKGKHAQRGNRHAPFGQGGLQCEACHGPGALHSDKRSQPKATINSLKRDSFMTVTQRNEPCLSCHQGSARNAWHAGAHSRSELACTDCHQLHADRDAVMTKATESEVCYTCHKQQRADFLKASSHPVRGGRMACSDCHNAHGSTSQASLNKPTLNQTCYTCHTDKRGPLLWEHAPVAEDCSLCHTPHGSPRQALLTKSKPLLCQECHSVAGHPAVARTGAALPAEGAVGAIFVVAGSCSNCHTQVHGSNHPAGAKLMR
jgi:DmsE family decaheme c-type cytochrome